MTFITKKAVDGGRSCVVLVRRWLCHCWRAWSRRSGLCENSGGASEALRRRLHSQRAHDEKLDPVRRRGRISNFRLRLSRFKPFRDRCWC